MLISGKFTTVSWLDHWLQPTFARDLETENEQRLDFVKRLHRYTKKLLTKARDIRNTVAADRQEKYLLPTALVKTAEKSFQFVYYAAYSFQSLEETGSIPLAPREIQLLHTLGLELTGAEYCAQRASGAFTQSGNDLAVMAQTGQNLDSVRHIRATLESTVFLGLLNKAVAPLLKDYGLSSIYHGHIMSLVCIVSQTCVSQCLSPLALQDWPESVKTHLT